MIFNWNEKKNFQLKESRGIGFERIVVAIEEGNLLTVLDHPNEEKYHNQLVLVIEIASYAFCVPCLREGDGSFFLKTIFPSRKYTKLFNLKGAFENE